MRQSVVAKTLQGSQGCQGQSKTNLTTKTETKTQPKQQVLKPETDSNRPSQSVSRRKPKVSTPDFTVVFSELDAGPPSKQLPMDLDESDEDLPDLAELMRKPAQRKSPSLVSNYSNSEIDALIRDAPMSELEQEPLNSSSRSLPLSHEVTRNYKPASSKPHYRPAIFQPDQNLVSDNEQLSLRQNIAFKDSYCSPVKVCNISTYLDL